MTFRTPRTDRRRSRRRRQLSPSSAPVAAVGGPRVEPLERRDLMASTPFNGVAAALPATIQAENFDNGGARVAYLDTTAGNAGGAYRSTDVDVEPTTDAGGGHSVGWIRKGEWLQYTVDVASGGEYLLDARVAARELGGRLDVYVDGAKSAASISIPKTGGTQTWTTVSGGAVTLGAGRHVVRLVAATSGATSSVGNLNWFRLTARAPTVTPPATPTNLSATAGTDVVGLSWTDNAGNETGFRIDRATTPDFAARTTFTIGADATSYTDTSVTAGTTYHYRVRAFNTAGESANTAAVVVATLQAMPTATRFVLVDADTDRDIRELLAGDVVDLAVVPTRNLNVRVEFSAAPSYVDLTRDGTTRRESSAPYSVAGYSGGNYSAWTPTVGAHTVGAVAYTADGAAGPAVTRAFTVVDGATVTPPPPPPVVTAPAAPTGLTATATSGTQVKLVWVDVATTETAYAIHVSSNGGASFTNLATLAANATTYTASGLQAATPYVFRVAATNAAGSSPAATASATTFTASTGGDTGTSTWVAGAVMPSAANTGPTNEGALVARAGGLTVTTNGAVIQNLFITDGSLFIDADNVTIRNVKIDAGGGTYGIRVESDATGVLIEDTEVYNMTSAGVYGGDFTLRRVHIHDSGNDGVKATENVVMEGCYVEKLGTAEGAHADGVQITAGANFTFRGNRFHMPVGQTGYRTNAAFMIQTNNGRIDRVLIERNWMNGGNYTIQVRDKNTGYGAPTNVTIRGNFFGRDYRYGVKRLDGNVAWSDNRWVDTKTIIN